VAKTKRITVKMTKRRAIANKLNLMRHEWIFEDPENGDIRCRFCSERKHTRTRKNCQAKPVPSTTYLEKRLLLEIDRQKKAMEDTTKLLHGLDRQDTTTDAKTVKTITNTTRTIGAMISKAEEETKAALSHFDDTEFSQVLDLLGEARLRIDEINA